jgi:hypothetical protein
MSPDSVTNVTVALAHYTFILNVGIITHKVLRKITHVWYNELPGDATALLQICPQAAGNQAGTAKLSASSRPAKFFRGGPKHSIGRRKP